jgi:hypothetical protein
MMRPHTGHVRSETRASHRRRRAKRREVNVACNTSMLTKPDAHIMRTRLDGCVGERSFDRVEIVRAHRRQRSSVANTSAVS